MVKKFLYALTVSFFTMSGICSAGFEDVLKDVLVESTRTIGNEEYVFRPGDEIISKNDYVVFFSGSEISGAGRVLLLTLVQNNVPVILKFPEPGVIQVKDISLQVSSFTNKALKVSVLRQSSSRGRY